MQRRGFDEHLPLFVAFGDRVAHLSPSAWDRLRVRCADLDSSDFSALVRRAHLAAQPHELFLPAGTENHVAPRIIATVSRAVQTSIAFASQIAAEFEVVARNVPDPPWQRTQSSGEPSTDDFIDAYLLVESALRPFAQSNPGLVTAMRAAGQAVLRHDWLSQRDFDAIYDRVEPEIPFAELSHPPNAARTEGES